MIVPFLFFAAVWQIVAEDDCTPNNVHSANLMQKKHVRSALLNVSSVDPVGFSKRKNSVEGAGYIGRFEGCPVGTAQARVALAGAASNSTRVDRLSNCADGEVSLLDFSDGNVTETCCTGVECSGCARFEHGVCQKCLGGYTKIGRKCLACLDLEGWTDPLLRTCPDYVSNGWCQGGMSTSSWSAATPNTTASITEFSYKGVSPTEACCACGGGTRAPTPFKYMASGKTFIVGNLVQELPHPQTASEYFTDGSCDLHSLGLALDASSGKVSGQVNEPQQVECTVTAKEGEGVEFNATLSLNFAYFSYGLRALNFADPAAKPVTLGSTAYSSWSVACTPSAPWLKIRNDGALYRQGGGVPFAASCLVTAVQANMNHTLKVAVFLPYEWGSMRLAHAAQPEVPVSRIELTVGGEPPMVAPRNNDATPEPKAVPPAKYVADCGPGSSFNDISGDVLLEGERIFTLSLRSGQISGSPSPFLFKDCGGDSTSQARCSKRLQCKIYGLMGFGGSMLTTNLEVSAFDDTCWAKVDRHFEIHEAGPSFNTCREWCRTTPSCAAYSIANQQCQSMRYRSDGTGNLQTLVKIMGCSRYNTCIHLKVTGEDWLSGAYCPGTIQDVGLPSYTKEGVAGGGYDSIHLQSWQSGRELWEPTSCPDGTKWVLRRAKPLSDFRSLETGLELRGEVLGCIDTDISTLTFDAVKSSVLTRANEQVPVIAVSMTVSSVPAARDCASPFEEEDARSDKKGQEKKEDEKEEEEGIDKTKIFVFDDVNTALSNDYFLNPCECFNENWAGSEFVHEDTWEKMPAGSNNKFRPPSVDILMGGASCEPHNLISVSRTADDKDGCLLTCKETSGCNYFWHGDYNGVKLCRLYKACSTLYREVNSNGALVAMPTGDVCMIADPERCWAEEKRRKYLANQASSSPCLFEHLLLGCDELLLMGGYGIESCSKCTYNPVSTWTNKKPMPKVFMAGSVLGVSCAAGYQGAELGNSLPVSSELLTCVDGTWLDSKGRRSLSHFECQSCMQTSKVGLKTFIHSNKQETWFYNKIAKEIRSGSQLATECLLPTTLETPSFNKEVSFQDWYTPLPVSTRSLYKDTGLSYRTQGDLSFGWKSQSGAGCSFPAGSPVAFAAKVSSTTSQATNGWREVTAYQTNLPKWFNAGGYFNINTGRFTAPVSGYYHFDTNMRFDAANDDAYAYLTIGKNGVNLDIATALQGGPLNGHFSLSTAGTVWLGAGDYVSVHTFVSGSSASYYTQEESSFSGHLVWQGNNPGAFNARLLHTDPVKKAGWHHARDFLAFSSTGNTETPLESFTVAKASDASYTASGWYEITGWTTSPAPLFQSSSSFDANTGRYTAAKSGVYQVNCNLRLNNARGWYFRVLVAIQGDLDVNNGLHSIQGYPTKDYYTLSAGGTMSLTAGQTVSCWVYSQDDTSWSVSKESGFSLAFIGDQVTAFHAQKIASTHIITSPMIGFVVSTTYTHQTTAGFHKTTNWVWKSHLDNLGVDIVRGEFTAPQNGFYHVSYLQRLDLATAGGSYFRVLVAVNDDTDVQNGMMSIQGSQTAPYCTLIVSSDVYLNAGDKLSPYVQSHGDSDFVVYSESGFSVHQIHTSAAFHAEKSGSQHVSASGWVSASSWRTTVEPGLFDLGNHFDETTGVFTADADGYYFFSANVRLDALCCGYVRLVVSLNDANTYRSQVHSIEGDIVTTYETLNVNGLMQMRSGDTARVKVYSSGDSSYYIHDESSFSGHRVTTTNAFSAYLGTSIHATGDHEVSGWSTASSVGAGVIAHASFDGTSFTATTEGMYHVSCNIRLDGGSGSYFRTIIAVDGVAHIHNGLHSIRGSPPSSYFTMVVDGNAYLRVGQRVSVYIVAADQSIRYYIQSESGFSAYFIGRGGDTLWREIPTWRSSGEPGLLDEGNHFDESTGRFTAPSSGYYHVSADMRMDGNGGIHTTTHNSYTRLVAAIDGNPTTENGLHVIIHEPVNTYYSNSLSGDVYLAAGETLSLYVYSSFDYDYIAHAESGFSVYSIGSTVTGFNADLVSGIAISGAADTPHKLQGFRTSGIKGLFSSGHLDTNTGDFTVPVAGYYQFSCNIRFDSATAHVRVVIGVDDQPSIFDGAHAISSLPVANYFSLTLETVRYLDKGQKVAVYVYHNSASTMHVSAESGWSGHLMHARSNTGFDQKLGDFKAPTTGYYMMDASLRMDGAGGSYTRTKIALNDAIHYVGGHSIIGEPTTNYYTHNVFSLLKMNSGDTASLWGFSYTDADWALNIGSQFNGVFLGSTILGFQAHKSAGTSVTSIGWTEVAGWQTCCDAGLFDTDSAMGSSRFQPRRAGYYHLAAMVRLDGAGGTYMRLVIARNGQIDLDIHEIEGSPTTTYITFKVSGNMYLSETDYASVFVYSASDSSYVIQAESSFLGYLITTPEDALQTASEADPQDQCTNTRWEMQVPNGMYTVTLKYGSTLASFDTHGCALEGFDASVGSVPAGQILSKAMSVNVVDGMLTFQGEKASGCSGLNTLIVEVANKVRWGSCNLGGWKMTMQDSTYQIEFITNLGRGGMCLGESGGISTCGNDQSQKHLLDHFPVLVSQWTHWITDQVFQGTCAKGQGSNVHQLTTHGTVACATGSALRTLDFVAKGGCGIGNTHQYEWRCSSFIQTPNTVCTHKQTACAPITGDLSNWRLDKFRLECPELTALTAYRFENCGGSSFRYAYTCCSVPGMGGCEVQETDWAEGAGGTLEYLSDHHIACKQGEALRGFVLDSKVPVSNPGRGEIRYMYVCCNVPMALPVSVSQRGSLSNSYEAWEGGYCPYGSVEGRLTFKEAAAFDTTVDVNALGNVLKYDMHAGQWCVAGNCVLHTPPHPIELPKDPLALFETSPRTPFSGEFEGKGVKDYEAPPEEEEGGGDGGLLPDPSKKKARQTFAASDFTLDTNFVSSVTFTPWRPTDCNDMAALPTEGEGNPPERCYLAFCKARNAGGLENFDGTRGPVATAIADGSTHLSQEGVSEEHPCYHAFNDQTAKRELGGTIWDIANPGNAYSQAGLNVESVYWCSSRDIERTRQMGNREAEYEIVDGVSDMATTVADLACDATPEGMTIVAPMGVGFGMAWDTEELCDDITGMLSEVSQFVNHMEFADRTFKFAANDAADCNPLQEGLARIYCDLYCIEDAVKKGDKSILDTIGNLYQKIKLTTKEMFDFYISQVLGKMGVFEQSMFGRFDAISDQIMNLDVKVGDQVNVRTGDLDTQLKDIISKLEKNLDVSTGTIDGTTKAIAKHVGAGLVESMHSAKKNLESLIQDMHKQAMSGHLDPNALRELQNLETLARHQAKSLRENVTQEHLQHAANGIVRGTGKVRKHLSLAPLPKSIPVRAADQTEEGLKVMEAVLKTSKHHVKVIRNKINNAKEKQDDFRYSFSSAGDVQGLLPVMLVEFDKQWTALCQSMSDFLEEADEHHSSVELSVQSIRSYTQCSAGSADYTQLLEEYKQLQRRKYQLEKSLRSSFTAMQQHLTLLANIVVDGGMLHSVASSAAPLSQNALDRVKALANSTEGHAFFRPHVLVALQKELEEHLQRSLPKQLSEQTKAAFQLAEHLAARHLSAGLKPREEQMKRMRGAWRLVHNSYEDFFKKMMAINLDLLLPSAPKKCGANTVLWAGQAGSPQLNVIDRNSLQLLSMDSDGRDGEIGQICDVSKWHFVSFLRSPFTLATSFLSRWGF